MFDTYCDLTLTIGRASASGYALFAHGPGGGATGTLALPAEPGFAALLARYAQLDLDEESSEALGTLLFQALFADEIKDVYIRTQGLLELTDGLRLVLEIDEQATQIAALPWELLHDPDLGPLALLGVAIVRRLQIQAVLPSLHVELPLRVLLTAASAAEADEPELQVVREALAGLGSNVQVSYEPHLTQQKLQRLLRQNIHIWHFIGQGEQRANAAGQLEEYLLLEDASGGMAKLGTNELTILLKRSGVRLVVLDACGTTRLVTTPMDRLAPAIMRAQVAAVITTQFAIPEDATSAFAREFYRALAEGSPIDVCVTEGRKAIMNHTGLARPDWSIPTVYTSTADGAIFTLPPPAAAPPAAAVLQPAAPPSVAPAAPMLDQLRDEQLPSGIITFLLTSVEHSSQLWERQPATMRDAIAQLDALIGTCAAQHNGVFLRARDEDDSDALAFDYASDALRAARAIQAACAAATWPPQAGLQVRIALYSSEANLRQEGYRGAAIQRCARLRDLGHGGQILVAQTTVDCMRDSLPDTLGLRDLGEYVLKDLSGWSRVFQLLAPELPSDFPALNGLNRQRTNLPASGGALIGREQDIARVRELIARPAAQLVTLIGPGGVGKTSLALHVAAAIRDEFPDGVYFVSLADAADAQLVPGLIAQAIGLSEIGDQPFAARLAEYFRDRRTLLLLDTFDHLVEATPFITGLLIAAPKLTLLVTSRTPLPLKNKLAYPVAPLALPPPELAPGDPTRLDELRRYPAVAMFVQQAQAVQPSFELTTANAQAVAQICTRLDGLPLAIELAAARTALLAPAALLRRLGLTLLADSAVDRPGRQQTLRATIEWSYKLLAAPQQALLARLAVFAGGCTLEAAEVVCGAAPDADIDVLNGFAALVNSNLLRELGAPAGDTRFGLLNTIREYALEQLAARGEAELIQQRHAAYFQAQAAGAEAELRGAQQDMWLDMLDLEHGNIRAAIGWAVHAGAAEAAIRLCGSLWRFWYVRGYLTEGRAPIEQIYERGWLDQPQIDALARAKILIGGGALARAQGDLARAAELYEYGLELYRTGGDELGIAFALNSLGVLAAEQGRHERARALHEESLALCQALGDQPGIAWALESLATIAGEQGDAARAVELFTKCLELRRQIGHQQGVATTLLNLGYLALLQNQNQHASELLEESLAISRELEDKQSIAAALLNLGYAALYQGQLGRAAALFHESLPVCQALDDARGMIECLEGIAGVLRLAGQPAAADRLAGAAQAQREQQGLPQPPAERDRYERAVSGTAERDTAGRSAAWTVGRTLTLKQALTEALKATEGASYGSAPPRSHET